MMNTYLTYSKIQKIKTARDEFAAIYGKSYTPFTRKIFFYFFILDNKKYVHKESLNFVYTNADTYSDIKDPYYCPLVKKNMMDICAFLEHTNSPLLPKLLENNEKFLVYEFYEGSLATLINKEEFYYLKDMQERLEYTPFYNSMAFNLVRGKDGVKLIDFKHFEKKDKKPFFVYMYNYEQNINLLYLETQKHLAIAADHLKKDYPVDKAKVIIFGE